MVGGEVLGFGPGKREEWRQNLIHALVVLNLVLLAVVGKQFLELEVEVFVEQLGALGVDLYHVLVW